MPYNIRKILKKIMQAIMHLEKCKSIPLQTRTGREGFRRLRVPDFKTIGT